MVLNFGNILSYGKSFSEDFYDEFKNDLLEKKIIETLKSDSIDFIKGTINYYIETLKIDLKSFGKNQFEKLLLDKKKLEDLRVGNINNIKQAIIINEPELAESEIAEIIKNLEDTSKINFSEEYNLKQEIEDFCKEEFNRIKEELLSRTGDFVEELLEEKVFKPILESFEKSLTKIINDRINNFK